MFDAAGISGGSRMYNAAPGAETKFRSTTVGSNGFFSGSSLFPNRNLVTRR